MARFVRGDVVVVPFPLSTGMNYKRRPAFVIAPVPFGPDFDYFVCACSATAESGEQNLIVFDASDFEPGASFTGSSSYIRPTTLFTIDGLQVQRSLGRLNQSKVAEVMAVIQPLVA